MPDPLFDAYRAVLVEQPDEGLRWSPLAGVDDDAHDAAVRAVGQSLLERASGFVTRHLADDAAERANVLDVWAEALDALDLHRLLCRSVATHYERRTGDLDEGAWLAALRDIFWCAQVICGEALALLRGGYPTGALARWRALYELETQAGILTLEPDNDDLAERYLDHARHYLRRELALLQGLNRKAGLGSAFDRPQMKAFHEEDERDWEQYGRIFGGQYGWAHEYLVSNNEMYALEYERARRLRGPHLSDLRDTLDQMLDPPYASSEKARRRYFNALGNAAVHAAARSLWSIDETGDLSVRRGQTREELGIVGTLTAEAMTSITDYYAVALSPDVDDELEMLTAGLRATNARANELLNDAENRASSS